MESRTEFLAVMLGSAVSGMLARVPMHPVDTAKARMQAAALLNLTAAAPTGVVHGAGGGLSVKVVGVPHTGTPIVTSSLLGVLRSTLRVEGFAGLYRGFTIAFLGSAPASCLYFTCYEAAKRAFAASPATASLPVEAQHFASGLVAESLSCVMWVPIDVVKERLQVQQGGGAAAGLPFYKSTRHAVATIFRTEGLRGVYKGYAATLASFGPFSALYFTFYEKLKSGAIAAWGGAGAAASRTRGEGHSAAAREGRAGVADEGASRAGRPGDLSTLPFVLQVACASGAGAAAALLTSPLDLVKLRLQVQRARAVGQGGGGEAGAGGAYRYAGLVDGLRTVAREEGVRGLWRGASARLAFHAPTTGISMLLFERCTAEARRLLDSP